MEATAPARGRAALVGALLVLASAVVWAPVVGFDFVSYDDPDYVVSNPEVNSGLGAAGLRWALTAFHSANWHPLTWLSHMLDCELYGLDPRGHHATSLLLHLLNVALTFAVLRGATGALWPSAFTAALFGLHPLHVESVAWIAERKDVLSATFGLLALGAWVRYAREGGRAAYATAFVLLGLGLAAKPMLVTWPLLFLLLDVWPLGRTARIPLAHLVREKLLLLVLSAASAIVTVLAQQRGGTLEVAETVAFPLRVLNAVVAYATYLVSMVWPQHLAVHYPHPYLPGGTPLAVWQIAGSALLLAAITALVLLARRRGYPLTGWGWYVLTLAPVIGIVQVGVQARADRYTYLPLTGVFIAIAWGARDLVRVRPALRRVVISVAIAIVAACGVLTRMQLGVWRDSQTLYARALEVAPQSFTMLENAGLDLVARGRAAEAIELHHRAVAIRPDSAAAHYNFGYALHMAGYVTDAMQAYAHAIAIDPNHASAHANLCVALADLAWMDAAAAECEKALAITPDLPEAHNTLGNILAERGEITGAIEHYRNALAAAPGYADAHANLGVLLLREGRKTEAAEHFRQALETQPRLQRARLGLERATQGP